MDPCDPAEEVAGDEALAGGHRADIGHGDAALLEAENDYGQDGRAGEGEAEVAERAQDSPAHDEPGRPEPALQPAAREGADNADERRRRQEHSIPGVAQVQGPLPVHHEQAEHHVLREGQGGHGGGQELEGALLAEQLEAVAEVRP